MLGNVRLMECGAEMMMYAERVGFSFTCMTVKQNMNYIGSLYCPSLIGDDQLLIGQKYS